MNYSLIISVSKSLLIAKWKQTLIAAIGVMIAIAMFIALLSFMTGLNIMLDGLILNRTAHIRLFKEIKPNPVQPADNYFGSGHNFISSLKSNTARTEIYNNAAISKALQNDNRVAGSTERITTQAFISYGVIDINAVVNGIDVAKEAALFSFNDYIVKGNPADLNNIPNTIILGKALAERMTVNTGDVIQATSVAGIRYQLKVVGLFQSGINDFDKVQCYASIITTQKLLNKPENYITDIGVRLKDMSMAPAMAKEYMQIFETDAEDIQSANAQFETGSRVRSVISYSVGIVLLLVAGFGIYNILNMMIYEKMDSIAIMKATGFSARDVHWVFMGISMGIGIFGGIAGLIFGFVFSNVIDQIPFHTSALPTITTFPVNYDLRFYIIGISFSLITTYFAGWIPSRKAGKVDPVIIIRGK